MKWWNSSRCKPKVGFIYTIDSDFAILSGLWEEHFYTWPRWIQANIKQSKIPKSFGRTQTVFQSSKLSTYNQESSRGLTKNEVSSYFHCLFVMCSCIWSMQERRPYSKNGHCFMINISSNWMSSRIMAHLQFFFLLGIIFQVFGLQIPRSRWFKPWSFLSPKGWRSLNQPFERGHLFSPSQKGHQQTCQE